MTSPETTPAADRAALADSCAQLQGELDALLQGQDGQKAVDSLDNAVASLKEVEQRNVSSVQLVALAD
ncbi:hypothetical protein ACWD6L_02580 [Micromonospora profundi]|uniref:Uncharacterized protein n=1 Tax=Micromonospora profundi TaxID=1420889 RepID=A0AAJ6HY25_9ACTN|nr:MULTISPECIES: hypothetical protein [Micromonospora]KOX14627.1 hypothetical protein ADK66_00090 [Micromonospora sp. NRRL B-16802]NJC15704.1 hypothetical protein [Micromonospora profundi]WLS47163.1 hypothetical protein Q3V37_07955 [Micromonospora profundi]